MKKSVVIFIVLLVFISVEASIVGQQQKELDANRIVICSNQPFAQTFTAGTSSGSVYGYISETKWPQTEKQYGELPEETFYDRDTAFRTCMVPELQGGVIMGFGGLFVLRRRKSMRSFPS